MHNKHVIQGLVIRHIQPMQKERGAFFLIHFYENHATLIFCTPVGLMVGWLRCIYYILEMFISLLL